jgi:hypothetical protein
MIERSDIEMNILWLDIFIVKDLMGHIHHTISMGDHGALRVSRRSARIENGHQIIRINEWVFGFDGFVQARSFVGHSLRRPYRYWFLSQIFLNRLTTGRYWQKSLDPESLRIYEFPGIDGN